MIIYWRVCEQQETLSFTPRWQNKDKREILRKCWISLQDSVEPSDIIFVLWDKVKPTTLDWIAKTSKTSNIEFIECPIYKLDSSFDKEVGDVLDKKRNHFLSIVPILNQKTKQYSSEIHYLCEDDYLHLPHALYALKSLYADGWNGFSALYDYPDRYTLDRLRNCELLLNQYSHWRTVPSTTATLCALGQTWQSILHTFKQNAFYNSDAFSWQICSQIGCLTPVPGMAAHLTENCLSPRVDWKSVYDNINIGNDSWE